jgi:hypothetical protein
VGHITKYDLFPVSNFSVVIFVGESNPLLLHSFCENWLGSCLSGGESKGLLANPLDLPDYQVLQGNYQTLQLFGTEDGIPLQIFPHEAEGVFDDGALYCRPFFRCLLVMPS